MVIRCLPPEAISGLVKLSYKNDRSHLLRKVSGYKLRVVDPGCNSILISLQVWMDGYLFRFELYDILWNYGELRR